MIPEDKLPPLGRLLREIADEQPDSAKLERKERIAVMRSELAHTREQGRLLRKIVGLIDKLPHIPCEGLEQ